MSLVGNLEDLGLGEILQIVSLSRKSGVLALHSRGREGRIVFRLGQVFKASSSSFQQNIGEVLVQKGIIDLSTLRQALHVQQDDGNKERLGSILRSRFDVSADAIEDVVRTQIENVVYSLFAWVEGTFEFELQDSVDMLDNANLDPVQFMLDQGLNPQFLAMEGSRIIDEKRHRGEIDDDMLPSSAPVGAHDENVDFAFDLIHASSGGDDDQQITDEQRAEKPLIIVDDDDSTREIIAQFLYGNGYDVSMQEKSEDALIQIDTMYREGRRPTVLVDLIMPKMDGTGILGGLELLELLRSNFGDLPVIVLADYRNSDAEKKIRALGYPFYLKPRKSEIAIPELCGSFCHELLENLSKIECGEEFSGWCDKVNIGDELRLEMGEDSSERLVTVTSTGVSLLRGMLEELNNPTLGGGITLLVLRFASEFMNRAVIFVVKKEEIVGLGQFGIDDGDGLADAKVRNLRIPRDGDTLFSRVIELPQSLKTVPGTGDLDLYLRDQLGGGTPAEVFIGPILSEGKVVAILYGDNLPDNKPVGDTDSLEIFLSQAGLAMEKSLLQRRLKEMDQEAA
jgi:CheY-like chemotaxis protein